MIDSIFVAIVRPSTWIGDEQDVVLGYYSTMLHAQDDAREWVQTHVYPWATGAWETHIVEQPLDRLVVRREYCAPRQ